MQAMHTNAQEWENLYYEASSPDNILLLGFKRYSLKKYSGQTLAEVAKRRYALPEEIGGAGKHPG